MVQADAFADWPSVTIAPLTSERVDAPLVRLDVAPAPANGLRLPSQIMVDKLQTVRVDRIGNRLGRIDAATLREVDRSLMVFLGIG